MSQPATTVRMRYCGGIRDGEVHDTPSAERIAVFNCYSVVTRPRAAAVYKFSRWLTPEDGLPVAEYQHQQTVDRSEAIRIVSENRDQFVNVPSAESS